MTSHSPNNIHHRRHLGSRALARAGSGAQTQGFALDRLGGGPLRDGQRGVKVASMEGGQSNPCFWRDSCLLAGAAQQSVSARRAACVHPVRPLNRAPAASAVLAAILGALGLGNESTRGRPQGDAV